jgi:hypothetical protein
MQYIHVKNVEKYHPGYKDRELKYAKIFFSIVQGDPEFELIKDESDKWRFVALICLELQARKPLPDTPDYWIKKGFDIKKRPMSMTIQMLHEFIEVVTEDQILCVVEKKDIVENIDTGDNIYADFEKSALSLWNQFCDKHPTLSKIREISESRRKHLKQRFQKQSFRDFSAILSAIEQQSFLINGNPNSTKHAGWKISFDWLIENDTNYVKVLELRYKDNAHKGIESYLRS